MTDKRPDAPTETDEAADMDWENRRLCPDGNCIGVIGSDGRCKECGRLGDSGESELSVQPDVSEEDDASSDIEPADEHEPDDLSDPDWENRKLCSDGNCIGVIGPDGRCKECGKPYEENSE